MSPPTPPNSFDGVSNCGTVDTGNTGVLPRGKGTFTHLHPTGFADHNYPSSSLSVCVSRPDRPRSFDAPQHSNVIFEKTRRPKSD